MSGHSFASDAGVAVLHVDDSPADRYRRRRALELAGFRVVDADTGTAAREAFASERADLVLLDVRLPDVTGFDLAREIRAAATAAERDVAIVLISTYFTESAYRVQGLESGADAYLIEPITDAELVATLRALTRQLEQLKRARYNERELRRADATKNDFLATVVHEVRQPIQAALAALAVMKSHQDPESVRRAQEVAERQLQQISRITSDLLDATRIVRGEVALRREPQDLCAVLRRSLETVRDACAERQLALTATLPEGGVAVEADAQRLEQVFVNLLSNAVRYTSPGGRIEVSVEPSPTRATVRVSDTGEGIPAEQLARIFDVFVRASDHPGGLGIGLSVARSLVESHGGTLVARSEGPGRGSEFTITLPVRVA